MAAFLALAMACVAVGLAAAAPSSRPPNVVLILIDDLGWKDLGIMGNKSVRTPNIDRLGREGMLFTDAYSCGPNCSPSRASLLSGLYGPRHGVYTVGESDRGPRDQQKLIPAPNRTILLSSFHTLPEALHERGYVNGLFGKWHLGDDPGLGPLSQGFDFNIGGDHNGQPPIGYFAPYGLPNLDTAPPGEYLTDRLTDEALRFMESHREKPFFAYLAHYAVHTPIQAPAREIQDHRQWAGAVNTFDSTYAAMIEIVDRGVGRVLAGLDRLGLTGDTVVFLLSDNGGVSGISSMAPLRGGKGMLYEGGIRVPFIARWPGKIRPGSSCTIPVNSVDIYPTVLEIAHGTLPAGLKLDGLSLLPLLEGRPGFSREAIFWHFPAYLPSGGDHWVPGARDPFFRTRPGGAVRAGDWKLIEYFEDGAVELYNLREDIAETRDLAAAEPAVCDRLLHLMRQWREQTKAPVPTKPNPDYRVVQPPASRASVSK